MEKILGSGFTIVLGKACGMERPSALVTTLLASRHLDVSLVVRLQPACRRTKESKLWC